MSLKKTMIIFTVLMMVCALGTSVGLEGRAHHSGPNVEEIYQSIKYATPLYEWNESIVTFENEGMTMVCSLTIPQSQHLCPIIITLNGFIGNRNDVVIPGTDEPFFKRFSRILAEQGIASLRIDFRGSGDSDGDYSMTTFSTQISDTLAAVDYICNNLEYQVNTKSIGIVGFSQGGLVGSTAAARDKRVNSLVLWSPVANSPHCYQGLLSREGIQKGLALPDGVSDMFGIYIQGQYVGLDIALQNGFFEDLFEIDPLAEIHKYRAPLMVIVGKNDPIVWPQPAKGQLYMKYHKGDEKIIIQNADHSFNSWAGSEIVDDTFFWSAAWLIKTLKGK